MPANVKVVNDTYTVFLKEGLAIEILRIECLRTSKLLVILRPFTEPAAVVGGAIKTKNALKKYFFTSS